MNENQKNQYNCLNSEKKVKIGERFVTEIVYLSYIWQFYSLRSRVKL